MLPKKRIKKKKQTNKAKWFRRIKKGAVVVGTGVLVASCSPKAKSPEIIMRDLNKPGSGGKVLHYVPPEFQRGGEFAPGGSAPKGTGARKGQPRPKPRSIAAKGSSGQWPQIFEIYPQWKPETAKGRATVNLVNRLSRQTGVSPVELLRIKEVHYATKYYLDRAKRAGKLSTKEIRVLEALIEAEKTDRKAYLHLHRLTARTWGSKKKIQQLTKGK